MSDRDLILAAGLLLVAGLAAAKVADRVRVPGLLFFLVLGMLAGSEGVGGIEFDDAELTRTIGTVGLILILFEGGLSAGWGQIRPVIGTAVALATVGTILSACFASVVAIWLLDLGTLEGLVIGAAIATTDSAAIFAVLRGSRMRRRLARALEGESGMNDPVALLLVTGFIALIEVPGFGGEEMALELVGGLVLGLAVGLAVGHLARWSFRNLDLPSPGLYPVASMSTAALAYGLAELAQGSGLVSVYIAALVLGSGSIPAKRTTIAFHSGLAWVSQISLFTLLGLLVFPSGLLEVAADGLLLSAALMFVVRPLATLIVTAIGRFDLHERLMLGWAGLKGVTPIWLATFPVTAGIQGSEMIFNLVFFVVVTSTLIQGATFEPLARRLRLTTDEPALPESLIETGIIRGLGGESKVWLVRQGDAIVGRMVKELGLPRDALVNLIVRGDSAIPPRGSTELEAGDELHIVVRQPALAEVERLTERWHAGPLVTASVPVRPHRGAPGVFSVRPWRPSEGDASHPVEIEGIPVLSRLRSRPDAGGALVRLADGRYAVTGDELLAVGSGRQLAAWCARRAGLPGLSSQEGAWWQEICGALGAAPSGAGR